MEKKIPSSIALFCLTLLSALTLLSCSRVDTSSGSTIEGLTTPSTPQQVGITNNDDALIISWTASTGASSYRILYGLDSGSDLFQVNVTGNTTQYAFYGLTNYQKYRFMVKAINTVGESNYSAEISASPSDITPPSAPTNLFALASTTPSNNAYISWRNPTNKDFAGVIVMRRENFSPASASDSASTLIYQGTSQNFTDTTIESGKHYFYCVYAYDKVSNYSSSQRAVEILIP